MISSEAPETPDPTEFPPDAGLAASWLWASRASWIVDYGMDWRVDDYSDERVNECWRQCICAEGMSDARSNRSESESSVSSSGSPFSRDDDPAARFHRLSSNQSKQARVNDGMTFLLYESSTHTPLARALRNHCIVNPMYGFTMADFSEDSSPHGYRLTTLSTPHDAMSIQNISDVKLHLEREFESSLEMDPCPHGCYTLAYLDNKGTIAAFLAFRAFGILCHKRGLKMIVLYVDHIVTNEMHRRKRLAHGLLHCVQRASASIVDLYNIKHMYVITQASFAAIHFWKNYMRCCSDATLLLSTLIKWSETQTKTHGSKRSGRTGVKLYGDVVDMMMELDMHR